MSRQQAKDSRNSIDVIYDDMENTAASLTGYINGRAAGNIASLMSSDPTGVSTSSGWGGWYGVGHIIHTPNFDQPDWLEPVQSGVNIFLKTAGLYMFQVTYWGDNGPPASRWFKAQWAGENWADIPGSDAYQYVPSGFAGGGSAYMNTTFLVKAESRIAVRMMAAFGSASAVSGAVSIARCLIVRLR